MLQGLGEDVFDLAGAGAEGEAVEELDGSLAVGQGDEGRVVWVGRVGFGFGGFSGCLG